MKLWLANLCCTVIVCVILSTFVRFVSTLSCFFSRVLIYGIHVICCVYNLNYWIIIIIIGYNFIILLLLDLPAYIIRTAFFCMF